MNKYDRVKNELDKGKEGSMVVLGRSMEPIIYSGSLLTFKRFEEYEVDDIVFCKVKKRIIDAHKILEIRTVAGFPEYMIGNNHGLRNGWTGIIYGKVINIEGPK